MEAQGDLIAKYMKRTYVDQAAQAIASREFLIKQLLEKGKWPEDGWDDLTIETLIQKFALMDSNNFPGSVGLGEREARIACDLVRRRHFHLGHGIGRSGDLTEVQPKAAGSSLLNKLCNRVVLDALRQCGAMNTKSCFVAPMATGMSITLCLLALREKRKSARFVIWPRIDQKSCFKCICTAGFEPLIIENKLDENGALVTDLEAIEDAIQTHGPDSIVCILSTTSCFAPRLPDNLKGLAKICRAKEIPHLVNNAYGLQSSKCMHLIEEASRAGRVDAFVQSADKNFLVPVGGSIIAGFDVNFVAHIASTYPGRGSAVPSLDLLITLLHLGVSGYKRLLAERKECFAFLKESLTELAVHFGEHVIHTKDNTVSIALTLDKLRNGGRGTEVGSMLFLRGVSGARVVTSEGDVKTVNSHEFVNWGSHSNCYPHSYLTAAAAVGVTRRDIEVFITKLKAVLSSLLARENNDAK